MKIINHKKRKTKLIISSICFSIYFLWETLPTSIPIKLDIFKLIILLLISNYFLISVYYLISKKETRFPIEIPGLDKIIEKFFIFYNIYTKIIFWSSYHLDYFIIKTNIFFYSFFMIPNFILIFSLFLDIFHFNIFYYFFNTLGISFFLLLYQIYKKLLIFIKIFYVKEIYSYTLVYLDFEDARHIHPYAWTFENQQEGVDEDKLLLYGEAGSVHFDDFLPYYIEKKYKTGRGISSINLKGEESIRIGCQISSFTKECHGRPGKYDDQYHWYPCKYTEEETETLALGLIQLSMILKHLEEIENNNIIRKVKLLIYSLHLICWTYLLITGILN